VVVTPNGAYAYVTNSGGTTVSVISTATNTVTTTITGLNAPSGMAVTPNGAYAYVTNIGNGTVSVISIATSTVTTASPSPTIPEFSSVVLVSAVVAMAASAISVIVLKARNEKTLRR
jgi:YVTN family beta-propeller protein